MVRWMENEELAKLGRGRVLDLLRRGTIWRLLLLKNETTISEIAKNYGIKESTVLYLVNYYKGRKRIGE